MVIPVVLHHCQIYPLCNASADSIEESGHEATCRFNGYTLPCIVIRWWQASMQETWCPIEYSKVQELIKDIVG